MSVRKSFGKIKEVIQPPNLIEHQTYSFEEFLQKSVLHRLSVSTKACKQYSTRFFRLRAMMDAVYSVSGVSSYTPSPHSEIECIREGITYSIALHVKLRLREEDQIKDEEIYMGELPYDD
jgi:DNA-directed RNA polymerase subunit beta